jgi:hypothetical protein
MSAQRGAATLVHLADCRGRANRQIPPVPRPGPHYGIAKISPVITPASTTPAFASTGRRWNW